MRPCKGLDRPFHPGSWISSVHVQQCGKHRHSPVAGTPSPTSTHTTTDTLILPGTSPLPHRHPPHLLFCRVCSLFSHSAVHVCSGIDLSPDLDHHFRNSPRSGRFHMCSSCCTYAVHCCHCCHRPGRHPATRCPAPDPVNSRVERESLLPAVAVPLCPETRQSDESEDCNREVHVSASRTYCRIATIIPI